MGQWIRNCLLFLSLLLACPAIRGEETADTASVRKYSFQLEMQRGGISGIMALLDEEGEIKGSLINEFGFSAVGFIYDRHTRKLRLVDVVSFLDRWYVRRVLQADLTRLVETLYGIPHKPGRTYEVAADGGTLVIKNLKRKITYVLQPLAQEQDNDNETTGQSI